MTFHRAARSPDLRFAAPLLAGGLLFMPFGIMEFLRPWGAPVEYVAERNYEVVTDRLLYWLSAAPGSLAVATTAAGIAALTWPARTGGRRPFAIGAVAALLGLVSLVGVLALVDPVATGTRMLGFLALGAAAASAAPAVARGRRHVRPLMLALAVFSWFLFAVWPMVYAVELVPVAGAAACFALYALGWAWLGALVAQRGSGGRRPPAVDRRRRRSEDQWSASGSRNAAVS